jgi:hypothetical protein
MSNSLELAENVRKACLNAAVKAYESAGISGLCAEGRWEMAVQAIQTVDLERFIHHSESQAFRMRKYDK